jgi:hypothetical protein
VSYGLNLVRLPAGIDSGVAYTQYQEEQARNYEAGLNAADRLGPIDPAKEERKQRLAAALVASNPDLKKFERNYARIAAEESISESEARRRFRNVELNDHRHSLQIVLFDDEPGVSFSFTGKGEDCVDAVRTLWGCLQVLESEGGYRTYDPQIGRVLDLNSDFDSVRSSFCSALEKGPLVRQI